jgi:penicillin-binding protein 1A
VPVQQVTQPRRRGRWRFWLITLGLTAATAAIATALLFLTYSIRFPDPLSLAHRQHAPVIRLIDRNGVELASRGVSADYVPLDLLPAHVADAVIATEDRRFYSHWGIDPWGMARAAVANLRAGRFAQGGSTLTQQLAKNLFLSGERTLGRKIEELTFALWLELRLGKRDILELYLNRVYFGGGAFGIEAASQRYFGRSARELDLQQAAVLAGLLKAPTKYSPAINPALARSRSTVVFANMVATGALTLHAAAKAAERPIAFASSAARSETGLEYAVEYILDRLPSIRGAENMEVIVETTVDAKVQQAAHRSVARHLDTDGPVMNASQASVVVMDTSGGIRALIGGRSYAQSQFNRAVKARRQPGSAFKAFVYLAAFENGATPETVGYDLPVSIKGWSPRNDNGVYQGAMTLRRAMAQSVNTIAAQLYLDAGRGRVPEAARRLGITSELRDAPALALGTSEVSLIELTGAYAVLSNEGRSIEPHVIVKVRLASGRVLYERKPSAPVVLVQRPVVEAMNDILGEVIATGTGRRAALAGRAAAGKTGTTQEFRDAWFLGYTAQLTAGVWVGNDSARPMNKVMGGTLPARIWNEVMTVAHNGEPGVPLPGQTSGTPLSPVVTVKPEPHPVAASAPKTVAESAAAQSRPAP